MKRVVITLCAAATLACGAPDSTLNVYEDAPALSWEEFRALAYEEEDGVFVANGDETFETLDELHEFYQSAVARADGEAPRENEELSVQRSELVVDLTRSRDLNKWSDTEARQLTYCISTKFGSAYARAVEAMHTATAEWEKHANVDFIHVRSEDSDCDRTNHRVVFDVNPARPEAPYLARAFLPNSSRRNRSILVSVTSVTSRMLPTLAGVLRHELGHVLGFRHEHTRPEAATCFEDNGWRELTPYDSASVMHYPQCNGTGDWSLTLTDRDREGAAKLYP